ncbi:hypothetical protein DV515_00007491 [Chloebia gouldiae]|uniref:Uncharacterized protein n=1 Tax=Chloebia gouldiae TaxID=44316 RepID=A0A3L8SI71_CHLGU|nr:hypothetical protein DV515_00007491 [Chloebia gouldiae]
MDVDSRQKLLPDSAPWAARTKQNSVILENGGSKGISQPCPRCVAGESQKSLIYGIKGKVSIKVSIRIWPLQSHPGLLEEERGQRSSSDFLLGCPGCSWVLPCPALLPPWARLVHSYTCPKCFCSSGASGLVQKG